MKKPIAALIGLASLALALRAGNAPAAGMQRPEDYQIPFTAIGEYSPLYQPSPFEAIDMLSGRPYLSFRDISLPGDDGLSLDIYRNYSDQSPWRSDYSPLTGDFVCNSGIHVSYPPSPFGLGWSVMAESIWFQSSEVDSPDLFTQEGLTSKFYACRGDGCTWPQSAWNEQTAPINCPWDENKDCTTRTELYFNHHNSRLVVTSHRETSEDVPNTNPWQRTDAVLFLPDGVQKTFSFLHHNLPKNPLYLTQIKSPHGAQISIEYTSEPQSTTLYGASVLPLKASMSDQNQNTYQVEFKYQDVSAGRAAWNANTHDNKCPPPATWLKRLDVSKNNQYLYSRYYTYYHLKESAYDGFISDGHTCAAWQGPNDHQLVNTFIYDNKDLPGDTIDSYFTSDMLQSHPPQDFWHFEPNLFFGCTTGPGCGLPLTCHSPSSQPCTSMCVTSGQADFHPFLLSRIVTPTGQIIQYNYKDLVSPHSTCEAGTTLATVLTRSETTRDPYTFRKDKFTFIDGTTLPPGAGLRSTVTIDGTTLFPQTSCFADGNTINPANVAANLYHLKKEYYFFTPQNVNDNGQLWKVWLPVKVVTSAVKSAGDPKELQNVAYHWRAFPAPIKKFKDKSGDDYEIKLNPCGGGTYKDTTPKVPVLDSTTVTQDGLTYTTAIEYGDTAPLPFPFPNKITSAMGGNMLTVNSTWLNITTADKWVLGMPLAPSSKFSGPAFSDGGTAATAKLVFDPATANLQSVSADLRTSSFIYDERGNLTTATGPGGVADSFSNFVSGMPGTVSAANGTYNAGIARDAWGRTTSVASTGGDGLQTEFGYNGPWLYSVQPSGGLAGSAIVYSMVKDGGTAGYQAKSFYYKLTGRKVVTDGGSAGKRVHQEWWDSAGRAWRSGDGPATGTGNTLDAANAVYSTVLYDACGGVRIAFPPHRNGDVSVAASGYISPFNIYLGFSASFRDAFGRPAIIGDTSGLSTGANFSIGRSTTYAYLKDGNSALKVTAHNSASTSSFYASVYGTTTIDRLQGPSPAALVATQTQGPLTGGTVPPSPKTTTYSYNARAQLTATNTSAAGVSPLLDTTEYNALGDPVSSRSPESGESRVLARDSRFRPVTISVPCTDPVAIVLNTSVSVTAIADSLFVRAPSGTTSSPSPSVRAPSGATSPPPLNSRSLMHTFFPSSLTTITACAITSAYDPADRLISLSMSGGDDPSSYSFSYVSGADLPSSESGSDDNASYNLEYAYTSGSPLPESSTITYHVPGLPAISFSLTFTRNPFGELTELNLNNAHTLHYTRDGLGRVTKVTRSAGATASTDLVKSILYQPNGSLMRLTTGNNILTDYYQLYGWGVPSCTSVYNLAVTAGPTRENAAQFYALIPGTVSGGTPSQRQFWTDQDLVWSSGKFQTDNHLNPHLQNVGPMVDGLNQFNTYDRESQLVGNTATSGPYKKALTYTYDPLHNRTQQVQRNKVGSQWILTATTTYAYDAATNRIKSSTLVNSKYPAPGNTKYYYHDARGNLTATTVTASVLPSDTSGTFVTHSYSYDLLNHLVSADSNRVRFAYLANGMKYAKLTESTLYGSTIIPPLATLYFYGPGGELIYEATYNRSTGNRISDTYYFHAAGLLVGELTSGNLNTPAFVSRQFDTDVGLYYLNARWYDPNLGRFVSVDPIPSSLNQYAYANNNPIRFQDASGLQACGRLGYACGVGQVPPKGAEDIGEKKFAPVVHAYLQSNYNERMGQAYRYSRDMAYDRMEPSLANVMIVDINTWAAYFLHLGDSMVPETNEGALVNGALLVVPVGLRVGRIGMAGRAIIAEDAFIVDNELLAGERNVHVYLRRLKADPMNDIYAGITNNMKRRSVEHGSGYILESLTNEPLTRLQARGVEQVLIEMNPEYKNLINSISPKNPLYGSATDFGKYWLRSQGFYPEY